jgi:hypothetical protein
MSGYIADNQKAQSCCDKAVRSVNNWTARRTTKLPHTNISLLWELHRAESTMSKPSLVSQSCYTKAKREPSSQTKKGNPWSLPPATYTIHENGVSLDLDHVTITQHWEYEKKKKQICNSNGRGNSCPPLAVACFMNTGQYSYLLWVPVELLCHQLFQSHCTRQFGELFTPDCILIKSAEKALDVCGLTY